MMKILLFGFVSSAIIGIGCHSPETMKQTASSGGGTTKPRAEAQESSPTIIKPNASLISAVIESLVIIDDLQYRIAVRINSSTSVAGMATLAEPGQQTVLSPQYLFSNDKSIETTSDRNKKLMTLRSAKPGDTFRGKISLSGEGKWVLVEVEDR